MHFSYDFLGKLVMQEVGMLHWEKILQGVWHLCSGIRRLVTLKLY